MYVAELHATTMPKYIYALLVRRFASFRACVYDILPPPFVYAWKNVLSLSKQRKGGKTRILEKTFFYFNFFCLLQKPHGL
jgi:hypothetical protein